MIVIDLVRHEWQKSIRSQGFYKNLAVNILLGFMILYMAGILLFLGFSLDNMLEEAHAEFTPMELFNGALLYILLGGLTIRFFMQQLNTINLPPYQVLPIKRQLLVNFLLIKPLFNPINYFHLFVVIPFAIQSVSKYYGAGIAVRFVLLSVLMVWCNSLLASFLKRKFSSGFWTFLLIVAVIAILAALEYFKVLSLFTFSKLVFGFILNTFYGLIFPVLVLVGAYFLNILFFQQNFYPESFNRKISTQQKYESNWSFLQRFGVIGEIIGVELKLILRHKRTKSMLYMSGFFLLYGLLFYTNDVYAERMSFLFFIAMFMTGLLMFMYGQWVISWDSSHFDSLMTKNIPIRTYIEANYYMMLSFNVFCFLLTMPYFYFGSQIIYMHLAAFIFNSGVNIFLLLFLATYNTKRIDLSKSSAMNYQGTTFKNFLIIIPIMFIPMMLVAGVSMISSMEVALWVLIGLGLLGIIFRKQLTTLCVNQFNNRKYALAEGFRKTE
jgi:hypothetical protein